MLMRNIINNKRLGKENTKAEIDYVINGYVKKLIPDYQVSAWLMAICLNGMTFQETFHLTLAFLNSGQKIDLSTIKGTKIDKHSTGGFGDKITLVLLPILISVGFFSAKISGRGLGFTGGTIDKLESIPGFETKQNTKEIVNLVKKNHFAIVSQSENIVPGDKKTYSLRDVTATVDSLSLLAASIVSKKLAINSDLVLLDVKNIDASNLKRSLDLAKLMIKLGKKFNRKFIAQVTNMNCPLSRTIGNRIEIVEVLEILKGSGSKDLVQLLLSSFSFLTKEAWDWGKDKAKEEFFQAISSGKALAKFKQFVLAQGGNFNAITKPNFLKSKYHYEIKATQNGIMDIYVALNLGDAATQLGAGRKFVTDKIDVVAGIYIYKKTNEKVKKGDLLFKLQSNSPIMDETIATVKRSYRISNKFVDYKLVYERLK